MIRRDAAPFRSASGIKTFGKRPLAFRLLHFAGSALRVFIRRKAWPPPGYDFARRI
jgi:hypothetical protein